MTPELQAKINLWRSKAVQNTMTPEDELEAIAALREGRKSAAMASEAVRTRAAKAAAPAPSGDDLLSEMMG